MSVSSAGVLSPPNSASPQAANVVAPSKKRGRKFLKFSLYGLAGLLVLALLAHVLWNRAGSNDWKLSIDKNGIKVWTLKTPGENLIQVKSTVRLKSKLSGMVKLLEDLESCVDAMCYDAKVIERLPTTADRYAAYVRFKFDIPGLSTHDYVLLQEHYQNPQTHALEINIVAAPHRLPRDTCCVRVTHLHNHWTLTPLPNGELDVEFQQDTDSGGLPYPIANAALLYGTHEILQGMQGLMDMEKYRNAHVDYIREPTFN